jgi:hypothetical protein
MQTWVSSQFDLPAIHEHPRIEFASPAKIASLRSTDLLPNPGAQVEPNNRASSAQHDTIAIYYDATRTIYLPEGWTRGTPAELSVLVHELAHHFQNVLDLKYECPQEREKLAYLAQDRWLGPFGSRGRLCARSILSFCKDHVLLLRRIRPQCCDIKRKEVRVQDAIFCGMLAQICRRKGSFAWTSPNMSAGGDSLKT